ncbi:MAG TPA: NAD(+)/NADH kinase [Acidimicrobiia bacterium]|nr:NAD(+)/NADH kinase [Acidimicrobiia bacterium]
MTPPGTVGLVPHRERSAALDLAAHIAERLRAAGTAVVLSADDTGGRADLAELAVAPDSFARDIDLAISLGGDGTMLRTVDLVAGAGVPVLGVNVGQLGYLAEVEPGGIDQALELVMRGKFRVEERMTLAVQVQSRGEAAGSWIAMNEAVIEKARHGHVVRLDVDINGRFFTSYAADGVIVATPTGSTAYSFSARGPIVSPRHRCLLLTPVSPHMLFDRSLVLDPDEELCFRVTDGRAAVLIIDGREVGELASADSVVCTGAPTPARIVTFGTRDFHQILKTKFGLADR